MKKKINIVAEIGCNHMGKINLAKKFIENNCSYRETAEWLSHNTGRKLTGMGLREVLKRVIHKGW